MDKIELLLKYIRRTNKEMTKENLLFELSMNEYSTKSLFFIAENYF